MRSFYVLAVTMIIFESWSSDLAKDRFMENPTIESYFALEGIIKKRINKMDINQLANLGSSSLLMNTIKIYYTHLLPEGYPERNIHLTCYNELYYLRRALRKKSMEKIKKNLQDYKICILYQFKENLPDNYIKALQALDKIK